MKLSTVLFAFFLIPGIILADVPGKVAEIRVFVPDRATLQKIFSTGIDAEGAKGRVGGWMIFVAAPFEQQQLSLRGIPFSIIREDQIRPAPLGYTPGPFSIQGFGYGSWSGFYTFDEVKRQLDSMKLLYPTLITAKDSIGATWEGRAIWMVKISDNPDIYEESEPEVLYTALHHAREPEGMEAVLYYMWWLLQHYGTDSTATYLVNNRQMYFIPVVNPDGYCYNQATSYPGTPGYGWRKNRRNNGDGSYGVDVNRNYGPDYMWNSPNGGSSTIPSSDTYRGPSPWSEPEIFTIDQFMRSHEIKTAINYHTFGNDLVYPYGYLDSETPDSVTFREFAFDLTADNRYIYGTDMETVAYGTRGNSDDYMYGDDTKPMTFAMTPEVGTTGFWPSIGEILPLAMENLPANIYLSYVGGQYSVLKGCDIHDTDGDGYLSGGESFTLVATVMNKGLADAANLTVRQSANSPDLLFDSTSLKIALLPSRTVSAVSFHGMVAPGASRNSRMTVTFTITDLQGYSHTDSTHLILGTPTILFADSASGGTGNWSIGEGWGTTSDAHSAPLSFTDSPSGDYDPDADNALTLKNTLNLVGIEYCTLKYWAKWTIEPTRDFLLVEASTNGGTDWTPLRASLMRKGSGDGVQSVGTWGYDGHTPGLAWTQQEIDLSPYANRQVNLRFRLISDASNQRDGFFLDDIWVLGYGASYQRSLIEIKDHGDGIGHLNFGENGLATNGIDAIFGETELGAKPARGTFDVRWKIPSTNGTLTDYRDTLSGPGSSNLFVAEFQPGPGGYPVSVGWNPHTFNLGGWRMRDGLTHGALFTMTMWTDTLAVITDTAVHSVELLHTPTDTVTISTHAGWNIVSVPARLSDRRKTTLYPHAISEAFAYQGTYTKEDTLDYHSGYWIKYAAPDTMHIVGVPNVLDTLHLSAGWWLVGGMGYSFSTTQLRCDPPPCSSVYIFRSIYVPPPFTVLPGEGFWMKGPRAVILTAMRTQGGGLEKNIAGDALRAFNTLTFTDASGTSSVLYFGPVSGSGGELSSYELPPVPPAGSFDVRFSSQRIVEEFQPGRAERATILLHASAYPVALSWRMAQNDGSIYEITDQDGKIPPRSLTGNGALSLQSPQTAALILSGRVPSSVPHEISLAQNYPNPFNPSSSIEFDLPTASTVSLRVFNALGQEVLSLLSNQVYPAGRHRVGIDGRALASGLYFYRLNATPSDGAAPVQLTKKMLLLH